MKKCYKIFSACLILVFTFIITQIGVKAEDTIIRNSKSGIVIEMETGTVLYEYESNKKLYPASTTKVMTLKLIFDAIKQGKLSMDQLLTTSTHAASMGGSQIYLAPNEQMKVSDLLKSVVIASANDAAVVLAEAIAGTEENFVKMMNAEAQRLKLKYTNFANATGLHEIRHYTTAADLATITKELLVNYEDEVIKLTSTYEDYIRKDTSKPFWLVNTNKLIKGNTGIDGLKTGWTTQAGYCLVATKKVDGMRVISVVMGAESVDERSEDTLSLMNYAFANYEKRIIAKKGTIIDTGENILLKPSAYKIILADDIVKVVNKNEELGKVEYKVDLDYIDGSKKENIGRLQVYINDVKYQDYQLNFEEEVSKGNFWDLLRIIIKSIL